MKTILRKLILVLSLALGLQTNVKAQKVYIPDANFRLWLNANFPSCMVGDSIDPTCPAVLNTKYIYIGNRTITNLTGIDVFVNDTILECKSINLSILPALPSSLKIFKCDFNNLTSLPTLPNTLTYLSCYYNNLTSLPTLPNTLRTIDCGQNYLTSLPALPSSLDTLFCGFNLLATLPTLPSNLRYLYCGKNLLTSLPVLNNNLNYLICNENQLTSLPSLPNSLSKLICSKNQLLSLPTLSNSLDSLECNNNQLNSLPSLPGSLNLLSCSSNFLTSLPALPTGLVYLHCNSNQLASLPLLPSSLVSLDCVNNQITSLPTLPNSLVGMSCGYNPLTSLPTLPNSLMFLDCYYSQLTSLPALPDSLVQLECYNNQLTSLPEFPSTLTFIKCDNNPITCFPDLNKVEYLYFSNTLVNCFSNYGVLTYSVPYFNTIPICNIFNSNGCEVLWNIAGTNFIDVDTNCINGINETGISNVKVKLFKNGVLDQIKYSTNKGYYSFITNSFDIYKTEVDTTGLPFDLFCPSTGNYIDTITATDSIKYDRNFAFKCKGEDLAATSIYTENLRPASLRTVKIQAGNITNFHEASCAAGVCGTVSITITGDCSYYSSPSYALTPSSIVGNVLTYNIADFGVISYDSTFDINLLVDTTASLGSQICITVNVYTKCVQELSYTNNQLTQCYSVVGSFDPNDKAVSPTTTMDLSGNRWLTYTIRFQNTGTASAEHILITDTISNDLILSTFTYLSSSHDPIIDLKLDIKRVVKFQFPFINLPDSNTNEPASHGYVQFKIKAKDSLTLGNAIENTANIYFDFNAPVITNTTSNTIIDCNVPSTNLSATLCDGDVYSLNGMEYYSTGIYRQNLLTAFGCDSTVRLNLTVNKSSITRFNDTLQATTTNAITYQWINCTTGTAIVGANIQTYNPTQSGSYSVVIDFGGCVDTSNCYYFSPVGINEINASNISIQPNPFNNELKVMLDKNYNGVIEVYNTLGALITSEKLQQRNITLNTSNWNAGVYILKIATNDGVVVKKVVKR